MIVRATSDLHGSLPEVEPCDVLIVAGDVCPDAGRWAMRGSEPHWFNGEPQQARWLDTTFREWLDRVPAETVIGIAGNHDYVFERKFLVPPDLRWTYLQDTSATVNGIEFFGTPWVPNLERWAFYGSNDALVARAEAIPPSTDVLISHGPPFGCRDFVPGGTLKQASKYGNTAGMRVGDPYLAVALVDVLDIPLVVCGHIHESYGAEKLYGSNSTVYNVALNDGLYNPVNPIVELPL